MKQCRTPAQLAKSTQDPVIGKRRHRRSSEPQASKPPTAKPPPGETSGERQLLELHRADWHYWQQAQRLEQLQS
jgi:hypothetical protein